jgi:NAD(P)H-dependent FMN reductase
MNAWSGASPGAIGGFGTNHHLRQSLVFLNVTAMLQPRGASLWEVIEGWRGWAGL